MRTARVTGLDLAEDGVLLVRAVCQECRETVTHGAGRDLDAPALGSRSCYCKCREAEPGSFYELADPNRVVPLRLRVIRRHAAEDEARRNRPARLADEEALRRTRLRDAHRAEAAQEPPTALSAEDIATAVREAIAPDFAAVRADFAAVESALLAVLAEVAAMRSRWDAETLTD